MRVPNMLPPFTTTRALIDRLDEWINAFTQWHLPLRREPSPQGGLDWKFSSETPEALQLAKAVRAATSIRGAVLLADAGMTTEAGSLLRMTADFAHEIIAVAEGLMAGRMTTAQQEFVDQFFAPLASTPEQLESMGKQYYVSREQLFAAHRRIAENTTGQVDLLRQTTRFLNYGYDKYVHGGYPTAMELFTGRTNTFLLRGHESARNRAATLSAVAAKLVEVLAALAFMAMNRRDQPLYESIRSAMRELEGSGEGTREYLATQM